MKQIKHLLLKLYVCYVIQSTLFIEKMEEKLNDRK